MNNLLQPSMYYCDFVAVQKVKATETFWVIETKGRAFEDTDEKANHMLRWCKEVSECTGQEWRFLQVSQSFFDEFSRSGTPMFFDLLEWQKRQRSFQVP